jgi:hypothetical protein
MDNNENKKLISKSKLFDIIEHYIKPELDKCDSSYGFHDYVCSMGKFYWHLGFIDAFGKQSKTIGALIYDNHWEIYNDCHTYCDDNKHTNIKIYTDHVEFIEDSEFNDFDHDFMYSLYEFLNDKIFNNKEEKIYDANEIASHIHDNLTFHPYVPSEIKIEPVISTEDIKNISKYIIHKTIKNILPPINDDVCEKIKRRSEEIITNVCDDKTINDLVMKLRNGHKRTDHKFLVCKRTNPTSNIWMYIKDVHITYKDTELTNDTNDCDDKISRIVKGIGGGCIWDDNLLVMDMDHEKNISDNEKYTLTKNLNIMLGWNAQLCDVTSSLAPEGELSTEYEFFK